MQNNATDWTPNRKVTVGTVAMALSTLIVWAMNTFVLNGDQQIGTVEAGSLSTVIAAVLMYWVPNAPQGDHYDL